MYESLLQIVFNAPKLLCECNFGYFKSTSMCRPFWVYAYIIEDLLDVIHLPVGVWNVFNIDINPTEPTSSENRQISRVSSPAAAGGRENFLIQYNSNEMNLLWSHLCLTDYSLIRSFADAHKWISSYYVVLTSTNIIIYAYTVHVDIII